MESHKVKNRLNVAALLKEKHPQYSHIDINEDDLNNSIYEIIDSTVGTGITLLKGFMSGAYMDTPGAEAKIDEYIGAIADNTINTFINNPTDDPLNLVLSNEQVFWEFSDKLFREQQLSRWMQEIMNIESAEVLNKYLMSLNKHEYEASVVGIPLPSMYDFIEKTRRYIKEQIPCMQNQPKNTGSDKGEGGDLMLYLNPTGEELLPRLKENFSGQKPKVLFSMLFALDQLGFLKEKLTSNTEKVKLAAALKSTFESRVDHQDACNYLDRFEVPKSEDQREIDKQKNIIKTFN